MISASRAWFLAFSTLCWTPRRVSIPESISEISTEIVPTSTGWPRSWASDDLVDDGAELRVLGLEDEVVLVDPDHRAVGRDRGDVGLVDLRELVGLGGGRARHARELLVHAEVVLEGDRREGLVLLADPQALLRLERLVEALGVAPALEHAAGELVDDQQLAVADDVLLVLAVERVRLQRLDQVVDQVAVDVEVEVLDAERLLHLVDAALGGRRGAVLLVHVVVLTRLQRRDDAREAVVGVGRRLGDAGDDERRAGLVDEDRVRPRPRCRSSGRAGRSPRGGRPCCRAGSRSRTRRWCRR